MTKNPNSMTMNPWNYSQLMAWGHFDQENKITHYLVISLWAITFHFDIYDMNNLGSKENRFNIFLFDTCTYLGNGTLSRDTLCDSVCWPKWVNEKMKKMNEGKNKEKKEEKKMIVTSCTEIFNWVQNGEKKKKEIKSQIFEKKMVFS